MPATCSETITFAQAVQGPAAGDPRTAASVRSMGDGLNQRARYLLWLQQRVAGRIGPIGGVPTQISAMNLTTGAVTLTGHNFSANQPVRIMAGASGGSFPTNGGAPASGVFYINVIDANTFGLSATSPGSTLTLWGGSFAGELYAVAVDAPDIWIPTTGSLQAGQLPSVLQGINAQFAGLAPLASPAFTGTPTVTALGIASGTFSRIVRTSPITWFSSHQPSVEAQVPQGSLLPGTPPGHGVYWQAIVLQGALAFELDLLNGVTLNSVSINIKPPAGHSAFPGGAPSEMPTFDVIKVDAAGVCTRLGTETTDASATAGDYETQHALAVTSIGTTINLSLYSYYAVITTEGGSGGLTGTLIHRPVVSWSGAGNSIF